MHPIILAHHLLGIDVPTMLCLLSTQHIACEPKPTQFLYVVLGYLAIGALLNCILSYQSSRR